MSTVSGIRWLNPPASAEDRAIVAEHERDLLACVELAEQIRVATGRWPFRLLLPSHWGFSFGTNHAIFHGLICETANVPQPLLAFTARL